MLYPFALVYGHVTGIRNYLFDKKVIKSVGFDFPVISVGNLSAGGTGKTPLIEYMIYNLQYQYKVATLSRGYGRTSHGFVLAKPGVKADQVGDEPRQFKIKYPETTVGVCEDRVLGVPRLLDAAPETDVILLDDAFQHRSIRPGLSILVTDYNNLFTRDELIPVGWLREAKHNYHRADIIVVSKCPAGMTVQEKEQLIKEIKPFSYQKIYFTAMQYGLPYSLIEAGKRIELTKADDVLLFCGIARYEPLKNYLQTKANHVYVRDFKDHHRYDRYDLESIRETFNNLGDRKKILITTEKDAARLEEHADWFIRNKIEIFVQPIAVLVLFDEAAQLGADIQQYIEVTKQKLQGQ